MWCVGVVVFGNTGSGKSNTLAKIYRELFLKQIKNEKFINNSEFIFIDFNGEYLNVFDNTLPCKKIELTTKENTEKLTTEQKFPINNKDLIQKEFWSIIMEATEKTQQPFINRTITKFENLKNKGKIYTEEIINLIKYSRKKYNSVKIFIKKFFCILQMEDSFKNFDNYVKNNATTGDFYVSKEYRNEYNITNTEFENYLFRDYNLNDDENGRFIELKNMDDFVLFTLALYWKYIDEISKNYITKEHVGPLMARHESRIINIEKIFYLENENIEKNKNNANIKIVSLNDLNITMKKIVPLIIVKKAYDEKKQRGKVNSSLHIIIDEAHNILSTISQRESEEWKDYRLECFEEIIKEGRKFGTFLTIASQRPSDISDTIISQLHNYFIHRLVNEEDLKKIRKVISFSDKASNDMIPILPAGGCLFAGLAYNFPVLVKINILPKEFRPKSENVDINKIWGIKDS